MESDKPKILSFFTPALLAALMFLSNFLSTDVLNIGQMNFTVWFVLSFFAFVCGWLINLTLGWTLGGKLVFAVIIAASLISLMLISFFEEYFGFSELLSENMILYTLRNVVLGSFGFFGMAVHQVFYQQRKIQLLTGQIKFMEKNISDASARNEIIIKQAELKGKEIVFEAEKKAAEVKSLHDDMKRRLKEFLEAEKELLRKYELDK